MAQNFKDIGVYEDIKKYFITDAIYNLIYFLERIKPQYRRKFFYKMQEVFEKFYQQEFYSEDKMLQFDATTFFHLNRIRQNSYYKYGILNFFDKFFRIEKWIGGYAVVVFSKYEFWIDTNKES